MFFNSPIPLEPTIHGMLQWSPPKEKSDPERPTQLMFLLASVKASDSMCLAFTIQIEGATSLKPYLIQDMMLYAGVGSNLSPFLMMKRPSQQKNSWIRTPKTRDR